MFDFGSGHRCGAHFDWCLIFGMSESHLPPLGLMPHSVRTVVGRAYLEAPEILLVRAVLEHFVGP